MCVSVCAVDGFPEAPDPGVFFFECGAAYPQHRRVRLQDESKATGRDAVNRIH